MEEWNSSLSLFQDVKVPSKRNLVKIVKSDGEANTLQTKKLKNDTLLFSCHTMALNEFVAPSLEKISSQDDLWKSIQSNYAFLMADDLISECQETRKELHVQSPCISSVSSKKKYNPVHTFEEFIKKFNDLHDALHSFCVAAETKPIKNVQCDQLYSKCQRLKEDGAILTLFNPNMSEEVNRRCNIISNKWDVLKDMLHPEEKQEKRALIMSLSSKMKEHRKWLKEVDGRLRKLNCKNDCATETMNQIYSDEKVLQREIETRGKELTSLVRQCRAVDGATCGDQLKKLQQAAAHLERSWHSIWIRSIEKQCLTEERILQRRAVENNSQDASDPEADEGPLNKHRRLTLDRWTAGSPPKMDKPKTGETVTATKDVAVACNERIPANDKCVMVGSTGIAALKAEYGDDFANFEIIQDVGYSSESSTHLSSDDSMGQYYRVYNYPLPASSAVRPSLKEELELYDTLVGRQPLSLASSLGSSSGTPSVHDSGLGASDTIPVAESPATSIGKDDVDVCDNEKDLEEILKDCVCFEQDRERRTSEDLHFDLSDLESDDQKDHFQNRSSFTSSTRVFYKMISVDSENGEHDESNSKNQQLDTHTESFSRTLTESQIISEESTPNKASILQYRDHSPSDSPQEFSYLLSSTPVLRQYLYDIRGMSHHQNLKRKRECDLGGGFGYQDCFGPRIPGRVRSWLKRCSSNGECTSQPRGKRNLFKHATFDGSSCDASGEYTSSSAEDELLDEDLDRNRTSSSSSFSRIRMASSNFSMEGSVETVVKSSRLPLLPPPLSSTPSCLRSGLCDESTLCFKRGIAYNIESPSRSCLRSASAGDVRDNLQSNDSRNKLAQRQRLSSSLPNVLPFHSDSSAEDSTNRKDKSRRRFHSNRESSTSGVSRYLSGSSDTEKRRKRRNRKRSSGSSKSSNTSWRSEESSLRLFRDSANSLSASGNRHRHFSQRSDFLETPGIDFQCEKNKLSECKNLPDNELLLAELRNASRELEEDSVPLVSPVDSDRALGHLEEQSTVSDQVWDNYQDMPYLSEAYSETAVDEDVLRKLTEFGDDYVLAIGQPIADSKPKRTDVSKSPSKKPSKAMQLLSQRMDTDSDSEDLHHLMEDAENALYKTSGALDRWKSDDFFTSAKYGQLLATCSAHLLHLQYVREQIIKSKENAINFSSTNLQKLHDLIKAWELLEHSAKMSKEYFLKAQTDIDAVSAEMSELSFWSREIKDRNIRSFEDLEKNIKELQKILSTLLETKQRLLKVNLEVHHFMTQYGCQGTYSNCSLKDEITELYIKWNNLHEQNKQNLTKQDKLSSDWKASEVKLGTFQEWIETCSMSEETCDTSSPEMESNLQSVNLNMELLRSPLESSEERKNIHSHVEEVDLFTDTHLPTSSEVESGHSIPDPTDDKDDHFHSPTQRLLPDCSSKDCHTPAENDKAPKKKRPSRIWRILRVAIPVHLTLVLLFCLACYLEPTCCDRINTFNFSFTPHLRYPHGPPPV